MAQSYPLRGGHGSGGVELAAGDKGVEMRCQRISYGAGVDLSPRPFAAAL
jgi:hypothetical protein